MTTDIIKVVATLAISIVFDSCHNVRETVEEAAVHADVSYDVKESEKEIISATNDFSFRLFQYLTDNNKENNLIISPLGVVYSLEIIGNGADGETRQKRIEQTHKGRVLCQSPIRLFHPRLFRFHLLCGGIPWM